MKTYLTRASALGIVILLASALVEAQEKEKGPPLKTYYPLQVGNQWSFNVIVGENSATAVSRIAKIEKIEDLDLVRLEAMVNGNVVATEHLRETDEGIFRHRNNGAEITPPLKLLKYPVKDGEKWQGAIKVGADKGMYYCEAKEEDVAVPAGKYKAIRVSIKLEQGKGQQVNTSYWFVKDIGFVKQTVEAAGLSIQMEMVKFEKGKDAPK